MTDLSMQTAADGFAPISWGVVHKSVSVMPVDALAVLGKVIDQTRADNTVKGILSTLRIAIPKRVERN